jgi:hypothetical protein
MCQDVTDKVYDHHMPKRIALDADDPNVLKLETRRTAQCYAGDGRVEQQKTFYRRLSALARRPDGSRHTRETLEQELTHEADEWKNSKAWHPQCRDDVIESLLAHIDRIDADADRWRKVEIAIWERRDDPSVQKLMADIGLTFSDSGVGVG